MKKFMEKRPLIGVSVIIIKDNQVLLGKRKNSHGSGTWAFPGGHLEFNETIEAKFYNLNNE
jgi:8-oxo-dGTP diphosphatase